jgi:hypothetical protein
VQSSGRRRVRLALLACSILLSAVALAVLTSAFITEKTPVLDDSGELCGSAWHFRPGSGAIVGGELDPAQRAGLVSQCRAAALAPYRRGLATASVGLIFLAVATVTGLLALNTTRRRVLVPDPRDVDTESTVYWSTQ